MVIATRAHAQTLQTTFTQDVNLLFGSGDTAFPDQILNNVVNVPASFGQTSATFQSATGPDTISMVNTVTRGLDPSVSGTLTANFAQRPGELQTEDLNSLDYIFEITGPASSNVPVDLSSILTDSWSQNLDSTGNGQFQIDDTAEVSVANLDSSTNFNSEIDDVGSASGGQTVNVEQTLDLTTNTLYFVNLSTNLTLFDFDPFPATAGTYVISASVDPVIVIDPSFLAANSGYSIQFSPILTQVPDAGGTLDLLAVGTLCLVLAQSRSLFKRL